MITIEYLADILNRELTKEFIESACELYEEGDFPIDPEHPDMEDVLGRIAEAINDLVDTLPLEDEYDR